MKHVTEMELLMLYATHHTFTLMILMKSFLMKKISLSFFLCCFPMISSYLAVRFFKVPSSRSSILFFFSQEQNLEDSTTTVQNCDPVALLIYNSIKCVGLVISVTNVVQYIPIIPNITEKPKYLISLSLLFYLISPLER